MLKKLLTYICMFLVGGIGFFGVGIEKYNTSNTVRYSIEISEGVSAKCETPNCDESGTTQATKTEDLDMQKGLNWLVAKLNIILDILTIIVTPAMILASWLMSPDWTSGDLFQIRPMLHDMWVIIANVTYFIYAILLIFIALATIFNSDKYGYKQLLPKLALGILMVPLTWWFIQFIISLSTIVTASVINIPMDVVINYNKTNQSSWWTEPSIPKTTRFENNKTYINGSSEKESDKCSKAGDCVSPEKFIEKAGGMYSNLMLYSFAVFKFQDVKDLPTTYDKIKGVTQIIHQGIIGAIMFIVYGLLVIALVFMLMMRAIKLWFYAIFSPLMTLKYVIGDGFFGGKENSDTFEIKEFVGLAFVPALVGLALSFGLIIVSVMMKPPTSTSPDCTDIKCTIPLFGIPDNNIVTERKVDSTETTVTVGEVKYIFAGDVTSGTTKGIKSGLNAAGGIIGTIIIDIIALVFIWVAFMAAKNVSKAVKAVVDPFESLGKKVGGLAMSLPKYAPILPGGMSIKGMDKVADNAQYAVQKKFDDDFKASAAGKMFGGDKVTAAVDEKRLQDILKNASSSGDKYAYNQAGEVIKKNLGTDIEYSSMFKDVAENLKKYTNPSDKMNILKSMGYSDDNSKKIIEKLEKHGNDFNKNDKELVSVMKSLSTPSGGTGGNNSSAGFTGSPASTPTGKIRFDFKNLQITADGNQESIIKEIRGKVSEIKDENKVDIPTLSKMLESTQIVSSTQAKEWAEKILKEVPELKQSDKKA